MRKPNFSSNWTKKLESRFLWNLYWMQQKIMEPYVEKGHNLIELGVGSGFCSNYLKTKGFKIETMDIDSEKRPDILCDITNWQPNKKYDGFLAFQVFEHMYFDVFKKTIATLAKAKIKYLYISVPHNIMSKRQLLVGYMKLPIFGQRDVNIRWPFWGSSKIKCKSHMWELDDGTISSEIYYQVFTDNGYKVIDSDRLSYARYNVFELLRDNT